MYKAITTALFSLTIWIAIGIIIGTLNPSAGINTIILSAVGTLVTYLYLLPPPK